MARQLIKLEERGSAPLYVSKYPGAPSKCGNEIHMRARAEFTLLIALELATISNDPTPESLFISFHTVSARKSNTFRDFWAIFKIAGVWADFWVRSSQVGVRLGTKIILHLNRFTESYNFAHEPKICSITYIGLIKSEFYLLKSKILKLRDVLLMNIL